MTDPSKPSDPMIPDAVWEKFGAEASGQNKLPPKGGSFSKGQAAAGLAFGTAVASCALLMLASRANARPDWREIFYSGLIGSASGAAAYIALKFLRIRGTAGRRVREGVGVGSPPIYIFHEPIPTGREPQDGPVEERLLALCKQDRQVFQRLLEYEHGRHPHLRRADLIRLAIEHFERDIH